MKAIFLDIDGVLCINNPDRLEFSLMLRLKRIIDATNAIVVLSSDWRCREDWFLSAKKQLSSMHIDIFDCTDVHPFTLKESKVVPGQPLRAGEILEFLKKHPEIERFVVIDDREDAEIKGQEETFFQTNPEIGITNEDVDKIIALLK